MSENMIYDNSEYNSKYIITSEFINYVGDEEFYSWKKLNFGKKFLDFYEFLKDFKISKIDTLKIISNNKLENVYDINEISLKYNN